MIINQLWPYLTLGAVTVSGLAMVALDVQGERKLLSLKQRRGRYRYGHASVLQYRWMLSPTVIKLSNGALLAMFEVDAPDSNTQSGEEVAYTDFGLARALSTLDESMVAHLHLRYTRYREYDRPKKYPQPELAWLDQQRAAYFSSSNTFRSRRILSITWLPNNLQTKTTLEIQNQQLEEFEHRLTDIESLLRAYARVRRLGSYEFQDPQGKPRQGSEMLEHLAWCISGRTAPLQPPPPGMRLNGYLSADFRGGFDLKINEKETRVIVLKGFPDQTIPEALKRLSEVGCEHSLAIRWLPMSGTEAKKRLKSAHTEWTMKAQEALHLVDPHTIDMAEEARQAIGHISSGEHFGLASIWIVLPRSESKERG